MHPLPPTTTTNNTSPPPPAAEPIIIIVTIIDHAMTKERPYVKSVGYNCEISDHIQNYEYSYHIL
jgi:hypothetical protein